MIETGQTWRLDGANISLVFVAARHENVDLAYMGSRLPDDENLDALVKSRQFGKHENQPDDPPVGGFLPNINDGYRGSPALQLQCNNKYLQTQFSVKNAQASQKEICFTWSDRKNDLELELNWEIRTGDMICSRYTLLNNGSETVYLAKLASIMLPIPAHLDQVTSFPGRWAGEMRSKTQPLERGAMEWQSFGGKAGFSGGDWLFLENSQSGECLGYHFAWSGDHLTRIEKNDDGQVMLIGGCPPELSPVPILPGNEFETPTAMFTYASNSDAMTARFHEHVRSDDVLGQRAKVGLRKVHLNSWEALAYDLNEQKLITLADAAADLGVERFILDDGWFKGRRSDNGGLGDWKVDAGLFPNGLKPLIDHVKSLGMDFGLWVEPEMVSPNSDLYRGHPEWCINAGTDNRATERNQLVLNLSAPGVLAYLFDCLDTLLRENDIAYLKWDQNRRAFPLADADGTPQFHQTKALYQLLDCVKNAHPDVEIESCSAGGGRADLAILEYCNRIWPSDNNDPIERLRIMQSWTKFLPLEILGNHVSPSPNPITGRRSDMDFRSKVALFGHMGVEANPADMTAEERDILKQHIALYKEWREVLHHGDFWQLDHPEESVFCQIVVQDKKAIAFAAQTQFAANFNIDPIRFKGLDELATYKIKLPKPWPQKASQYLANPEQWADGLSLSGRVLMAQGVALPLIHPETAWVITLEKLAS